MEQIIVKKPKYIRKYDFIGFFNRNEDEWFYKSDDLSRIIDEKLKTILKSNSPIEIDNEEDDLNEEHEFDSYEYFKELESTDKKIIGESDDPKVIEGNKIDKLSRSFIRETYRNIYNVVDFDDFVLSNEDAATKTLEIMKMNNHDFIMFQPCFIYKNKAITKPDAFIRKDNKYILIETKGTTSAKMIHLVDVIFQSHVISHVLKAELNSEIFEFKLCLVAYEKAKKNEVTFILTDRVPISKSGWTESEKDKSNFNQKYSSDHIKFKQNIKIGTGIEYTISDLINKKIEPIGKRKNTIEKYHSYIDDILKETTFEKIINQMSNHQIVTDLSFEPVIQYKDWVKTIDYWNNLKEYYFYNPSFFRNSYSGYVITYKEALSSRATDVSHFFNELNCQVSGRKALANYSRALQSSEINIYETAKSEFHKLKRKRIYFDFESLNLATRVIDNTVPFIQTVNQVSVIVDHGDGNLNNENKQNIVIDPLDVNIESLEQIIDAIYPKSDAKNYSYVVYNKSFEKSRLTEMAEIINSQEYYDKVKVINENIYDLADFFDPRKDWSIVLPQLHGFYSIKKVLPEIRKMRPDLFDKSGSVDYKKDLQIHNGSEAQVLSTKRFFGKIPNDEWEQIEIDLKKYCENDVRAMIAITYWLETILK